MQDVRSVVKYNFLRIDTMCLRAKLTVALLSFVMSFAEIFFLWFRFVCAFIGGSCNAVCFIAFVCLQ